LIIRVRKETDQDILEIEAVTEVAFLNAPHTSHTEQFIVNALRDAGQLFISLVAEDEGGIVGHVALSPVVISNGANGWYGLGPISVLPERQGCGVGSQLMTQALLELEEAGAVGCVLLGDPGFYGRFGLRTDSGLQLPGVPAEYFLVRSFRGAVPAGTVSYHEAFNAEY
jgi:predicted N-acetyltransferase YhbS